MEEEVDNVEKVVQERDGGKGTNYSNLDQKNRMRFFGRGLRMANYSNLVQKCRPIFFGRGSQIAKNRPIFWTRFANGEIFKPRPKNPPIFFGRGSCLVKFQTSSKKYRPIFCTSFANGKVFKPRP